MDLAVQKSTVSSWPLASRWPLEQARQRKTAREEAEVALAEKEEEEMVEKTVLQTVLFDPVLMAPESRALKVSYALGGGDLLLVWLCEVAEMWLEAAQQLVGSHEGLRVLLAECGGSWKDQAVVGQGMEWFEMSGGPSVALPRVFEGLVEA